MRAAIFAFTKNGASQAIKIHNFLISDDYEADIFTTKDYALKSPIFRIIEPSLKAIAEAAFKECRLIVFVGSLGIAVRTIAPFIEDKATDPAVLCVDDLGKHIIPVLSGHIGGANSIARKIADILMGTAIITTATDINGVFSVDEWAARNNMHISNVKQVKMVAKGLLDGEKIGLHTEFDILDAIPNGIEKGTAFETGIFIGFNKKEKPFENTLSLLPKIIHIGIGCRKGTTFFDIENAVLKALDEENISINAVCAVASIDLKKDEEGLLEFANNYNLPISFYSANQLEEAIGSFSKSDFVKRITSVDNVCERAAVLSSKGGSLIKSKTVINGITVALTMEKWGVSFEN